MTFETESIELQRHGRKLWQYKDSNPTRVELAVLDYLKDHGWRGYFTEHFDYDQTLLCMMCWCNSERYFAEKRKSLAIKSLHSAFHYAPDGFWRFDCHKVSQQELIENAKGFDASKIAPILEAWQHRGVKSDIVGRAYLKPRHASELNADYLVSFYLARGDQPCFTNYLQTFFPEVKRSLLTRAGNCMNAAAECRDDPSLRHLIGLAMKSSSHLGVTRKAEPIDAWIDEIASVPQDPVLADLLSLAKDTKCFNETNGPLEAELRGYAKLDLTVWRDGRVVSVEVKAPGDRLQPHQKKQLDADIHAGIGSWVIEVNESWKQNPA